MNPQADTLGKPGHWALHTVFTTPLGHESTGTAARFRLSSAGRVSLGLARAFPPLTCSLSCRTFSVLRERELAPPQGVRELLKLFNVPETLCKKWGQGSPGWG